MAHTSISEAEWQVMEAVWALNPPGALATDVVEALRASTTWTPATIKTMLNRLVKKRVLVAKADGRRYLYSAAVTREQCVRAEGRSFLDRVFGGETGAMLAHFARHAKLSPAEIDELKSILDQQSSKPGKSK